MKFSKARDYIWYRTKTDDTSLSTYNMLMLCNVYKDEIAQEIIKQNEDYFILPATTDLVANQREYPFPANILNQIKAVELKFATADTTYIRAREIDLNTDKVGSDEATIVANYDNDTPAYDIMRGSLWIRSGTIVNATAGIKLWFASYPADFTSMDDSTEMEADPTTTTFGFPKPFHELLCRRVSIAYKDKHGIPLDPEELNYGVDLKNALESIRPANLDRAVIGSTPYNDGSNY